MLPRRCNMIKDITRAVYVALGLLLPHLSNNSWLRKCLVLKHGSPKMRKKVNNQIKPRSVYIFRPPSVP